MIKPIEVSRELDQFQTELYHSFGKMSDGALSLLHALCSNKGARSVAELSLNPLFERGHGSIYQTINALCEDKTKWEVMYQKQQQLIGRLLSSPSERPYWLFTVDVTATLRPDAATLTDRQYVYSSQGVGVGHQYSIVSHIPELAESNSWAVPLGVRRATSDEPNKELLGMNQLKKLLNDPQQPFHGQLCVSAQDRAYSNVLTVHDGLQQENLVQITRLRNNRVVYGLPEKPATTPVGHPKWYGDKYKLNQHDQCTVEPDHQLSYTQTTPRGRTYRYDIKVWNDRLVRGRRKPFTLVQVNCYTEAGTAVYKQPLWLAVHGTRRQEVLVNDIWPPYQLRSNTEHFHRFGKQHLLWDKFQSCCTEHDECWWWMGALANALLFAALPLAQALPRPWEKPKASQTPLPPS